MNRRGFLKTAGAAIGATAIRTPGARPAAAKASAGQAASQVAFVIDPADPIAAAGPAVWAVGELESALKTRGVTVRTHPRVTAVPAGQQCIVITGSSSAIAKRILADAKVTAPASPEALALVSGRVDGREALLATGSDTRGLVYAVLELADRGTHTDPAAAPLDIRSAIVEKPANTIRSCARCFQSDVEDKAWFHDRGHWRAYLTMLAAHRFNRFNLTLGLGYNTARNVPDAYFYFAYPFLLAVPGYDVRAVGLPDAERDRNLETLRFISDETVARGLQFNLALWSHAYEWPNPDTNYRISGLTPATHAPYCRDALVALLKSCPNITGLSVRMHGESGIPDGNYEFWETLFSGLKSIGRRIDIDQHAKSTDERHIAIGLSTGNSVSMVPKFWAEHLGMPYHQASIRPQELRQPRPDEPRNAATTRRFLRYGYGDYLKEDRNFGILHRVWPGTQRHLLWGDPVMAAGYGRAFSFAGSVGVELFEPLSFKGRIGSGIAGGRNAYLDKSLETKYDWQKFEYQYRVWGRLTYNPDADADGWRRYLRHQFQAAAQPVETALGSASRILPIITTTHDPSASNNQYWPEMYTNMPIVDPQRAQPYSDTPEPKKFGTVTSLDPQLFASVDECAEALTGGKTLPKYTPLDVAQWLEDLSATASENLARALSQAPKKDAPEMRRLVTDVAIQAGIGRFFAFKFRSGVLWSIYERTGDKAALTEALKAYRTAREAWVAMADKAKSVYAADITYGRAPNLRGHWADRIVGIDADIADMDKRQADVAAGVTTRGASAAIRAALARPHRPAIKAQHAAPRAFEPGKPVDLTLSLAKGTDQHVFLHYRRADQSQAWQRVEMTAGDGGHRAAIPADYTQSPYPLLYYFEVDRAGTKAIYPGFNADLSNRPYYLVRSSHATVAQPS